MLASRWISYRALLSCGELQQLIEQASAHVYDIARIYRKGESFSFTAWLEHYQKMVDAAREQEPLPGPLPAIALSCDPSAIEQTELPDGRGMTRACKPVILIGPATYRISDDHQIFTNVLGGDSKFWGVDFRYPTLFQPKNSGKALKILGDPNFPNGRAFRDMAKWLRKNTRPVSFEGIKSDLRIGADAQEWARDYENRYTLHWG